MQYNQGMRTSETSRLSNHTNTIIEFNRFLHDKTYNDDSGDLGFDVTELLYELLSKWSDATKTTERWKNAEPKDFGDIIFLHAYDDVLNVPLQIGMNKVGIYLQMGIASPENLPQMPETFLQHWLDLSRLANFELLENEPFSDDDLKQHPSIFPSSTSNIYQLMRSIIAFPILYGRPMELGNLSLTWPYEEYSISEVITNGTLAFNNLCQLNNMLKTD